MLEMDYGWILRICSNAAMRVRMRIKIREYLTGFLSCSGPPERRGLNKVVYNTNIIYSVHRYIVKTGMKYSNESL